MTARGRPSVKKGPSRLATTALGAMMWTSGLTSLSGTIMPPPTPPVHGPASPTAPADPLADAFTQEQDKRRKEIEDEVDNLDRAARDEQRRGAEVSGPPPSEDPLAQASRDRAERFGEAAAALDPADRGVAEAEQRLAEAQAAERSLGSDATALDRAAARYATVDAQVDVINAQSARDQVELDHHAALHEGELAVDWARRYGTASAPDIFREQAMDEVLRGESSIVSPRPDGERSTRTIADRSTEILRDAPGPDVLGERAAEQLRAVGERAEARGRQSEAETRRVRAQERNRVAADPTATTDLDATLDGHLGELNRSLQAARTEANRVASDADRQAKAERLQVMADRREGIEQTMRESFDHPAQRSNDVAFVPPEVTARVSELSAEASRRLGEIDARVVSVHKAREEAFAAIDSASRSANITAENARESVADARRLANEGPARLPPVVIGEQQDRVDYAARLFQAERYGGLTAEAAGLREGSTELEHARLAHNEAWLREAIADGRVVIDTGPAEPRVDYPRPTQGAHGEPVTPERPYRAEAAYEMERRLADPYGRTADMSKDMSRTVWQDASGQRYVRDLDETARDHLRAQGVDPDTVTERAWKFGDQTYGAGVESAPTRDLVPEDAVPAADAERVDGAARMAVRLDAGDGQSRIAKQGASDEARETRDQILEAHERGESVTLYRLVRDTEPQRPFNDQLWTTYDPSSIALSDEHVETRELAPDEGFAVGNYRGGTPIGAEVAVARDPAAAPSQAPAGPAEIAPIAAVSHEPSSPAPPEARVVPPPGSDAGPTTGGVSPPEPGGGGGADGSPPAAPVSATSRTDPAPPPPEPIVQEQAANAEAEQEQPANAQAEQEQAARTQAEEEQAAKPQQEQAATAAQEQEQSAKAKAQQEQAAKGQAQQEQAAKGQAQQEQAAKAKAQQEQAAKAKAQQEQAAKAKAQQEQAAAKAKAQQEQAAVAKSRQEQVAKAKAQQEQTRQGAQQEPSAKESNSRAAHQRQSQQRDAHQRRSQEAAARQQQPRQQETPQRGKQK